MRPPLRSSALSACTAALAIGTAVHAGDSAPPSASSNAPSADAHSADAHAAAVERAAFAGADWLARQQLPSGEFRYGWLPALNRPMPGDQALRQAGAAAICARAGVRLRQPAWVDAGRKASVRLLAVGTEVDPRDPQVRRPTLPPHDANPVGFAALLLWAIAEIEPADPTLEFEAERLGRYLASRQRADGSFNVSVSNDPEAEDGLTAPAFYPGEALYALMRSHRRRPAAWKLAAVETAFPYYRHWFRAHPHEALPPWMCAAYAEAFRVARHRPYAEFVFELADWCLALQHVGPRETARGWEGGFGSFHSGQWLATEPGITTASFCEGLAAAQRTAVAVHDRTRAQQYAEALRRATKFLVELQYAPSNTGHFQPEYARKIHGGFRAGLTDGALRIDQNQHAVHALLQYREATTPAGETRTPTAPARAN